MKVCELRKSLEGLPDEMPVTVILHDNKSHKGLEVFPSLFSVFDGKVHISVDLG